MTDRAEPGVTPRQTRLMKTASGADVLVHGVPEERCCDNGAFHDGHECLKSPGLDAATPRPGLVEALVAAMNDAYTYEDRDNSIPTLRFVDDIEGFWEPFAEKVAVALASGTGEPRLDEIFRTFVATLQPTGALGRSRTRRSAIGTAEAIAHLRRVIDEARLANDKGADPTPEPK